MTAPTTDRSSDRIESSDVLQSSIMANVLKETKSFYHEHRFLIKESHGWLHAQQVYNHAIRAVQACRPPLDETSALEIQLAALLHDVDDVKYFPLAKTDNSDEKYRNAARILKQCGIPEVNHQSILFMIDQVSCSKNGNSVPSKIKEDQSNYLLIPRWADRIEAVGARGVWRCYQYNQEHGAPLSSELSPRPQTLEELWSYVTSDRFEDYQRRGGTSCDMISHYYDKLLHVACPPNDIVRNSYLQECLQDSAKELIDVCLRYGQTGNVDEEYIQSLKC